MLEIILKILEGIKALWSATVPPIAIEIHRLSFNEIRNDPTDVLVVIAPHPRRFFCELSMTNRKPSAIYVREIRLQVGNLKIPESHDTRNLRLEPSERKTISIVFPVDVALTPVNTFSFLLTVIPTVGRQSKVEGYIPVIDDNS